MRSPVGRNAESAPSGGMQFLCSGLRWHFGISLTGGRQCLQMVTHQAREQAPGQHTLPMLALER